MQTVRIPQAIYGDITILNDCGDELGLSDECISFINKLRDAKMQKCRNAKWYEVNATDDEVSAIAEEVMTDIIARMHEYLDEGGLTTKDRRDIYRYINTVQKWIDGNMSVDA